MNLMHSLFASLALLATAALVEFPLLRNGDLQGWLVSSPQYYDGSQLYGYINGGAEVYREFGFDKVAAQTLENDGHEVQVDVYRMKSASAAFGVFSIARSRCGGTLKSARWSCVNDNQVQFCKGPYFVNITVMDRAAQSRDASRRAAEILLSRMKEKDFTLPGGLIASADASAPRYVRGPLALAQTEADWLPLFEGIGRFDLYVVPYGEQSGATLASFTFVSTRDVTRFLTNAGVPEKPKRGTWVNLPGKRSHAAVMVETDRRLRHAEARTAEQLARAVKAWNR